MRSILARYEAAETEGFKSVDRMAILAGWPPYESAGYRPVAEVEDATGGLPVPLIKMRRRI